MTNPRPHCEIPAACRAKGAGHFRVCWGKSSIPSRLGKKHSAEARAKMSAAKTKYPPALKAAVLAAYADKSAKKVAQEFSLASPSVVTIIARRAKRAGAAL